VKYYDIVNRRDYLAYGVGSVIFIPDGNLVRLLVSKDEHRVLREAIGLTDSLLHGQCLIVSNVLRNNGGDFVFIEEALDAMHYLLRHKTTTDAHDRIRHVIRCMHDIVYDGVPLLNGLRNHHTKDPIICSSPRECVVRNGFGEQDMHVWEFSSKFVALFDAVVMKTFFSVLSCDIGALLPIVFYEARFDFFSESELLPLFTAIGRVKIKNGCNDGKIRIVRLLREQMSEYARTVGGQANSSELEIAEISECVL
jgi:hypothetical protein